MIAVVEVGSKKWEEGGWGRWWLVESLCLKWPSAMHSLE